MVSRQRVLRLPELYIFSLNTNKSFKLLDITEDFSGFGASNTNHDGSYEGLLYRDAVRKRSYHDSLNKRRTPGTIFKYMMQWSKLTNNRWPYQVPLHHYFI